MPNGRPHCKGINDFIIQKINETPPSVVVLGALWPLDLKAHELFQDTIAKIKAAGSEVIVLGAVPQFSGLVPQILADRMRAVGNHSAIGIYDVSQNLQIQRADEALIKWVAKEQGVHFISPVSTLCPEGKCRILTDDGLPIYYDAVHLSDVGSLDVGKTLAPRILSVIH